MPGKGARPARVERCERAATRGTRSTGWVAEKPTAGGKVARWGLRASVFSVVTVPKVSLLMGFSFSWEPRVLQARREPTRLAVSGRDLVFVIPTNLVFGKLRSFTQSFESSVSVVSQRRPHRGVIQPLQVCRSRAFTFRWTTACQPHLLLSSSFSSVGANPPGTRSRAMEKKERAAQ